ncbi:hypothetical protein [Trichormus azollae]
MRSPGRIFTRTQIPKEN